MNICLSNMTKALARTFYQKYVPDPALLLDGQSSTSYEYCDAKADATVDRHRQLGRVYLAVMLDETPIGEVILKNIDHNAKHCTLSICLCSDEYKNKGYGTAAERLALQYAFSKMDMEFVLADTVLKNTRSQRVLEKVGFSETHRDDAYVYYRCDRKHWNTRKTAVDPQGSS